MLTSSKDDTLKIIDISNGRVVKVFEEVSHFQNANDFTKAIFSSQEQLVLVPSSNGSVVAFNQEDSQMVGSIFSPFEAEKLSKFCQIGWQPKGDRLAAIDNKGTLTIWN